MLRELFLGFIRVHILFHADEAPVYGVALMTELGRHGYRIGPGTLYPILHTLEGQGFLRPEKDVVDGKVRKYYRTTPSGRRILARAKRSCGSSWARCSRRLVRRRCRRASGLGGRVDDGGHGGGRAAWRRNPTADRLEEPARCFRKRLVLLRFVPCSLLEFPAIRDGRNIAPTL